VSATVAPLQPARPLPVRDVVRDVAIPKERVAKQPRQPGFKVRATAMGYFNDERKRPGDVFTLKYAHQFSHKWMERADARTPERTTTGQQELRRAHDETLKQRASSIPTAPDNPIDGPDVLGVGDDEG